MKKKTRRRTAVQKLLTLLRRLQWRWLRLWPTAFVALVLIVGIVQRKAIVSRLHHTVERSGGNSGYDGIDVSKHQGRINWTAVAGDPNIHFVYIKATEGATLVDTRYDANLRQAREAGLAVGSYHFFLARRPAKVQFENFKRCVDHSKQDLLPMVDVEESGCRGYTRQQLQANLNEFMQLVKAEYGKYPVLYSQYRFYNEMLAPEFNRYYLFIARYSSSPPVLRGEGRYNIWQYSERGHVDGIRGTVDLNRFCNGTTLHDIRLK